MFCSAKTARPFLDKSKPIAYIIHGKSWVNNHAHVLRAKSGVTQNLYIKYALEAFDFTDHVNGTPDFARSTCRALSPTTTWMM